MDFLCPTQFTNNHFDPRTTGPGDVDRWCDFEGKSREMSADLRQQVRCHVRDRSSALCAAVLPQILKLLLSAIDT